MVTPEARPFKTTGGLADVAGALPHALARMGHRVTLVMPRYRGVDVADASSQSANVPFGPNLYPVTFHVGTPESRAATPEARGATRAAKVTTAASGGSTTRSRVASAPVKAATRVSAAAKAPARASKSAPAGSVTHVFIDAPDLFDRDGLYGDAAGEYTDNAFRFAVLSRGALEYARLTGDRPSVIHAHDWQSGLVPLYLRTVLADDPVLGGVPSVFTIHNVAFQGLFSPDVLRWIDISPDLYGANGLEFYGRASLLKAGTLFSDKVTTVSPTYARELLSPGYAFAFDFEGILASRAADFSGILNGIDTDAWDPARDRYVPEPFNAGSPAAKIEAKRALLKVAGLPSDSTALKRPTIGLLSRLTYQKGFDLLSAAADSLMKLDATWVLLGDGDRHYEEFWTSLAQKHPDRVATRLGFDEHLAHLIHAGSDLFLMPSRYEPCGLNQMYAMRYGTLPVVRATGGLEDTVQDADEAAKEATGFRFRDFTADALVGALQRALDAFGDSRRWKSLQRNAMKQDHSWDVSAREYVKVYRGTAEPRGRHGFRKSTDADRRELRTDDQRRKSRTR
ncbi:MAG: glycogen synthase [Acidobacteria bacterium]|nr:MAG: glycogen synthase [Acidobacteriota bacterium]